MAALQGVEFGPTTTATRRAIATILGENEQYTGVKDKRISDFVKDDLNRAKRIIYAVVYGNYDPPEVDSLFTHELDAVEQCEKLNSKSDTGMWEVQPMRLMERVDG